MSYGYYKSFNPQKLPSNSLQVIGNRHLIGHIRFAISLPLYQSTACCPWMGTAIINMCTKFEVYVQPPKDMKGNAKCINL